MWPTRTRAAWCRQGCRRILIDSAKSGVDDGRDDEGVCGSIRGCSAVNNTPGPRRASVASMDASRKHVQLFECALDDDDDDDGSARQSIQHPAQPATQTVTGVAARISPVSSLALPLPHSDRHRRHSSYCNNYILTSLSSVLPYKACGALHSLSTCRAS